MSLHLSPEQLKQYRRTARKRWQAEQKQVEARRERAWELAREAAALLKNKFGVQRVVIFGSLTQPDSFTLWSDVDLAAWGLTSDNWLRAIGAVWELGTGENIELNLVDVESCSPELLKVIERDGVNL